MGNRIEIAPGTIFGGLTTLGQSMNCDNGLQWECKCVCGRVVWVLSSNLRKGNSKRCFYCRGNHESTRDIHGTLLTSLKKNAESRSHKVEITMDDLQQIWDAQEGRCALSGRPLVMRRGAHDTNSTASVDRINSNLGYHPANVQFVHKHVNIAKNNLDETDFFQLCRDVVNYKDQTKALREGKRPWLKGS